MKMWEPCVWSVILVCLLCHGSDARNLPVVLWHGMGASSGTVGGTSIIKKILEDNLGSYVLSISTGKDAEETYSGFYGNILEQVDSACQAIASREELSKGYNGLGLSQGGLFLRAVAERCGGNGTMHTLVTLGSPHQGVINIPTCTALPGHGPSWNPVFWICRAMQRALEVGAYLPWDPDNEAKYLRDNAFLPEINNELFVKNPTYKENLASLDRLVLFRFTDDFTVVPMNSAWFAKVVGKDEFPLKETDLWKENFIGLQDLDAKAGLIFDELSGFHMQFSREDLIDKIIKPYLQNSTEDSQQLVT